MGQLRKYLSELYSNGGERLSRSVELWRSGINTETDFWSRWFDTKGLEWPEDYNQRMRVQPLSPWLVSLLPTNSRRIAEVLDVGSGPITKTGSFVKGRKVRVTATDPLAHHYSEIMKRNSVTPPVRTQFSFAEDLSARFVQNRFDLIVCTNALDHSIEPAWGIIEMLMCLKRAGNIFLGHRQNEAEFEAYAGFHQWNFEMVGKDFIIWNERRRLNMTKLLNGAADVTCKLNGDFLSVVIKKKAELKIDRLDFNRHLRASLLEALLMTAQAPEDRNAEIVAS